MSGTSAEDLLAGWGSEPLSFSGSSGPGFVDTGGLDTTGAGSSGINAQGIAKALQGLGGQQGAQKPAVPNLPGVAGVAPGGIQANSNAYSGSATGMNQFLQALMARVEALRAASNPAAARPVNMAGGGVRGPGLLGL